MLTNFVTDADLRKYFPKLASYVWTTQADYSTQIAEAFELVLDDLRAREIDVRRMHTPIDLNWPIISNANRDIMTVVTSTVAMASGHNQGIQGFRRFCVNVLALNGTTGYTVKLQGSNDISASTTQAPTNWADVVTITPAAVGLVTVAFSNEYQWYRVVLAVPGSSPSIQFTAYLLETYVDRWIIWRTFQMIFQDFSKESGDIWHLRAQEAMQRYQQALTSAKFGLDTNKDNLLTEGDQSPSSAETSFSR